jgi:hypothetical protein
MEFYVRCDWMGRSEGIGSGPHTSLLGSLYNRDDSGIVLSADIHRLFNRDMLRLEVIENNVVWRTATELNDSEYRHLNGQPISQFGEVTARPHRQFIDHHGKKFNG